MGRRSVYGQASLVDMTLQKHWPMKPAELVVAIRETGYRADANPHATMAAVRQLLRRYTKRFVRRCGWAVGQSTSRLDVKRLPGILHLQNLNPAPHRSQLQAVPKYRILDAFRR
jgi:hypothetical protein